MHLSKSPQNSAYLENCACLSDGLGLRAEAVVPGELLDEVLQRENKTNEGNSGSSSAPKEAQV